MHNIDDPFEIIVVIFGWITLKFIIRYIFIWWVGWLNLEIEIFKISREGGEEVLYDIWIDITPIRFLLIFSLIFFIVYSYKYLKDEHRREIFIRRIFKIRRWRCGISQFRVVIYPNLKKKIYLNYLRPIYVIYTGYRYDFFFFLDKLIEKVFVFFERAIKLLKRLIKFFKFGK